MTIPKLTPYTGQVANPDGSQTQSEFTTNMFNQLSYEANLATELDATIDGMNNAVDGVEANAAIAENSANAAEAAASSAGYQGLWPDTGGSALKGETWQTQVGGTPTGEYYTALQNTSVDPVLDNVNWRQTSLTKSLMLEGLGKINKGFWDENPELESKEEFVVERSTGNVFGAITLPYQVDSATNPDPNALVPSELVDVSRFATEQDVQVVTNDLTALEAETAAIKGSLGELSKRDKDSLFNSRSYVKNRQHKGYTFIGDSITSGTYDNVSWCEKVVFGLAKKWGTKNIAYRSLQESDKTTIHDVTFDGSWDQIAPAPASIFGSVCTSSTVGAEITVTPGYPTYGLRVGYIHDGSDFSFSIEQEGGHSLTVNAVTGARKNLISELFATERSLKPIKIKVLSGTVQLTGIEYVDSFDEPTSLVLARGGRSIRDTDTSTLTEIESISSGTIVFSLGYNDKNNANTSQRAEIIAKVQHLITLATASNRQILINDFMWDVDEDHWLRSAYINFEKNNANVTLLRHPSKIVEGLQSTSNTYRINTIGTFRDSAHPNGNGYEWLAGVVRNVIGCEDGEDYRKSLLRPDYKIKGTGNSVRYRQFVESSSLSETGNKTGKLVIKLPVKPVSPQFFWEFKLSIFTFPANKVGEIAMYCYKDSDNFSVLNYDIRNVNGLDGITIAETVLDGYIAIAIGDNSTVWGYPTAHISESKVSFYAGEDLVDEVTTSIATIVDN